MIDEVTRQDLEKLGIYDLRNLARQVGVPSPTTMKSDEMIDYILDVQCGNKEPVEITKRGRPIKPTENVMVVKLANRINCVRRGELPNDKGKTFYVMPEFHQDNLHCEVVTDYADQPKKTAEKPPIFAQDKVEVLDPRDGVLDIVPDGNYGFLRAVNCEQGSKDTHVSTKLIKAFGLRKGDYIKGQATVNYENKPASLIRIDTVNDMKPLNLRQRSSFDNLVPIYPDEKLRLELTGARNDFAIRCIDLIAPIGKGQRAMIVSPPKAGKTTLLKKIANSITVNNPEVKLFVLLVDERPEEVTDMQRSINGEVIYSTFDETPEHHCKVAELVIERAKRNVELGKDVVIIMDSLTRLARAYNLTIPPTGRTLSGGIDPGALHSPKRFFGAARNIEKGGSLTIIATALVDTGSRMDDVIYEEFKGTGNMEIHLDRKLSEKRIFPAIDLNKSGTRREELLLDPEELEGIWAIRKMLAGGDNQESAEKLIDMIVKTRNNKEFIDQLRLQLRYLEKEGYTFRK